MGKTHPEIDETLRQFMQAQSVFFVATSPLDARGHVNLSPKGLDTFRILGPRSIAYLDVFGSGVETIAHLRENGRIVVMFCAFQGAPKVLRLHGQGRAVEPHEAEFAALQALFRCMKARARSSRLRSNESPTHAATVFHFSSSRRNGRLCQPGAASAGPKV